MLKLRARRTGPHRSRSWPTRTVRTAVVCLPADTAVADIPHRADAVLSSEGLASAGVLPHFATNVRRRPWQIRQLVDCWDGFTSGGPVTLLDLSGMRTTAAAAADIQWQVWNEVVRGTKPAEPLWVYLDRFRDDPARHPLVRVQTEYRSQPRILAMAAHNAAGAALSPLPTTAVEAFQAGHHTFVNTAWLAAVPGDGFAPMTARWITSAGPCLADTLAFLSAANTYIDALSPHSRLVAVASPDRDVA